MITHTTDILSSRPMAWAYARVSDDKQWDKGNSVPEQTQRMEAYYRYKLGEAGVDWGGVDCDERGVSASKREFALRPAGARIMARLRPGDHLIIDKLDRLWRDSRDFENLLYWFKTHNITLHIVNLDMLGGAIDTGGAAGELMLRILAAFAHQEARVNSERVLAHNRAARKAGRAICRFPSLGTKHVKRRVGQQWGTFVVWDPDIRAVMQEIVRLREIEHVSEREIAVRIEEHLAERNGRQFTRSAFYQRMWNGRRVRDAYVCEKYLQDHQILDVCDLPSDFIKTARAYARERGYLRVYEHPGGDRKTDRNRLPQPLPAPTPDPVARS